MSDCIIHIGMHKTGSSSIQHSLLSGLNDENFRYVNLEKNKSNLSGVIQSAFIKRPEELVMSQRLGLSTQECRNLQNLNLKRLESFFLQNSAQKFILSGEEISNLDDETLLNFSNFLSRFVKNFFFVGYIRSPKSFMESAFQQRLKVGLVRLDLDSLFPKYSKFKKFDDIFGFERVTLWKFDPPAFVDGDVVMDFCSKLGIPFNPSKSIRVNESMSLSAVKLLYCYRKFYPDQKKGEHAIRQNNKFIKILQSLPGGKIAFHSSLVLPFFDRYRSQTSWMEERLNASLYEPLTQDNDTAIRSEDDLLIADDAATNWLAQQLGSEYVRVWQRNMPAQQIAEWMHALYQIASQKFAIIKYDYAEKMAGKIAPSGVTSIQRQILLKEKNLSEFKLEDNFDRILTAKDDAIFISGKHISQSKKNLNDLSKSGYVLSLHNSRLIPPKFLSSAEKNASLSTFEPSLFRLRIIARLLFTQNNELISDSFLRNKVVHPSVLPLGAGNWEAPEVKIDEVIGPSCFFVDLIPGHFGHALLELPARLWPLLIYPNIDFKKYLFVGFPTHGLSDNTDSWPLWLKQFMEALGLPLDRIRLITKPTICRNLVVPERISPFNGDGGLLFNLVMQKAGEQLLMLSKQKPNFGRKIFLSRSRLVKTQKNQKRSLGSDSDENLDRFFENLGFSIVHPQELSLPDQVAVVRDAEYIAGCVGSQMHLTAFCNQEKLKVLRISPSFFCLKFDAVILRAIGASFHDYIIQCDLVDGAKPSTAPWTISDAQLSDLYQFAERWATQ